MTRALGPILKTILFTIFVPGTVTGLVPFLLVRDVARPEGGAPGVLGILIMALGAAIYFRCAWEFAVRGLGTPAPISPTKSLVVTGLHRYVRNPMYIGVLFVLLGEAALFRALVLPIYAAFFCVGFHLFVIFYEEPTRRREFGQSHEEYCRKVPRRIPRLKN